MLPSCCSLLPGLCIQRFIVRLSLRKLIEVSQSVGVSLPKSATTAAIFIRSDSFFHYSRVIFLYSQFSYSEWRLCIKAISWA